MGKPPGLPAMGNSTTSKVEEDEDRMNGRWARGDLRPQGRVWETMAPRLEQPAWGPPPLGSYKTFFHLNPYTSNSKSYRMTPHWKPLQTVNKSHCQTSSAETEDRKTEKLELPSGQNHLFAMRLQGCFLNTPYLSFSITQVCVLLCPPKKNIFHSRKRNLLKEKQSCQNPVLSANFHQALEFSANGWFCNSFGFANPLG